MMGLEQRARIRRHLAEHAAQPLELLAHRGEARAGRRQLGEAVLGADAHRRPPGCASRSSGGLIRRSAASSRPAIASRPAVEVSNSSTKPWQRQRQPGVRLRRGAGAAAGSSAGQILDRRAQPAQLLEQRGTAGIAGVGVTPAGRAPSAA